MSAPPPAVGHAPGDRQSYDRERDSQGWRAWYRTARWQRLRLQVFQRDGYVCQKTGVLVIGKHPADNAPVAHHDKPHRGDERLFWDKANIITVSKGWHDTHGDAADRAAERGG